MKKNRHRSARLSAKFFSRAAVVVANTRALDASGLAEMLGTSLNKAEHLIHGHPTNMARKKGEGLMRTARRDPLVRATRGHTSLVIA